MFFLHIKSLSNLLFGVLCLPGDQSHPFAQPTINPLACCICWADLLGRAVFPPWNEGPNFGSYRPSQRGSRVWPPDLNVFIRTSVPGSTRGLFDSEACLTQSQESPPRVPLMPIVKLRAELNNSLIPKFYGKFFIDHFQKLLIIHLWAVTILYQ